ncbi:MAG: major facilitator superfamily [Rhodospirillaceae bacterium]|nr:MAG: major facilitator superfamily [Rhodospirillaceae bacterium]TNC96403.1 MAG: major facilitator superfamily permease [Stygiobacter sp.]
MTKLYKNIWMFKYFERGVGAVRLLCLAEVLTMGPVFAFPALLPEFISGFGFSSTQAGWLSGITFAGYAAAVPTLSALTDRLDARRVYVAGALVAGLSALLFALLTEGFWTALVFRALAGIGLAGTYMPGLKALVDRSDGPDQPKWMSWYTASFSLGTGVSFLAAGLFAEILGWRGAFALLGGGALVAALLTLALDTRIPAARPAGKLLDLRPVVANRRVMAYVLGYFAHMWELFGLRSWMVAFLAFAAAGPVVLSPTLVAALSSVVAMIASIGGAALALKFDRIRACSLFAMASAGCAVLVGLSSGWGMAAVVALMLVYNGLVQLDSAALTTGAVLAAAPERRGASIAVHSLIGFAGAFLGPLAFGWILQGAGGPQSAGAWALAFASLGAVAALGPLALIGLGRDRAK